MSVTVGGGGGRSCDSWSLGQGCCIVCRTQRHLLLSPPQSWGWLENVVLIDALGTEQCCYRPPLTRQACTPCVAPKTALPCYALLQNSHALLCLALRDGEELVGTGSWEKARGLVGCMALGSHQGKQGKGKGRGRGRLWDGRLER